MDGSEQHAAREAEDTHEEDRDGQPGAHEAADRAAKGLRNQIKALRRQVKDAQETLREHHRRSETRSFKR
jgi:hypothetical protein